MANGTKVAPKNGRKLLYSGSGTYVNDIGVQKDLLESESNFSILEVICFVGNIASSTRVCVLYPTGVSAAYLPCAINSEYSYIRFEASGSHASIISSSFSTLYLYAIYGIS